MKIRLVNMWHLSYSMMRLPSLSFVINDDDGVWFELEVTIFDVVAFELYLDSYKTHITLFNFVIQLWFDNTTTKQAIRCDHDWDRVERCKKCGRSE